MKKLLWILLGWMALSSFLSPWPTLSIEGFYMRMEGLLTWVILFILADTYWKIEKDFTLLGRSLLVGLLLLIVLHLLTYDQKAIEAGDFRKENWFAWVTSSNIGIATFAGLSLPFLLSYNVILSVFGIFALIISKTRSAWIAAVCGVLAFIYLTFKPNRKSMIRVGIIALLVLICLPWMTGKQLPDLSLFGTGSRPQWILQSDHLTYIAPITGYGLDTQSKLLKHAVGLTEHRGAVADRVHFLPMDIILQIGWIGYLLCLVILAKGIHITLNHRTSQNVACLSVIVAYIAATCFNPSGIPAISLLCIGLFGIKENYEKDTV